MRKTVGEIGYVSGLMIGRANQITEAVSKIDRDLENSRPLVDHYKIRGKVDPFSDASLLEVFDSDQHREVHSAIEEMI